MRHRDKSLMNWQAGKGLLLTLVGGALFLATAIVLANGLGYTLAWWTVDGGGAFSAGRHYTLGGGVGQPDADAALTGGGYTLVGGMWTGAGSTDMPTIYVPLILKGG